MKLSNVLKYFLNKHYRFYVNSVKFGFHKKMNDSDYLKRIFMGVLNKKLDLDNPKTFNEKIQWLKLFDRKDIYTKFVDKYEVKDVVSKIIGKEYVIPTLGVWDSFDEIDFNKLPNQFVLKCTHDSGGIVICRDKAKLSIKKAKRKINKSLKRDYYSLFREWPYKNVKPRIIAEQYIEDSASLDLKDYKFFCFNGKPEFLFVASDRQNPDEETKFDFFDMNFKHLNIINGHPNSINSIPKPSTFDKMVELCSILAEGIPHVRCDFYEANGRVYFGEMTFSHFGGLVDFEPDFWNEKIGGMLKLPCKNR